MPKRIFQSKPGGKRPKDRPKKRWLDSIRGLAVCEWIQLLDTKEKGYVVKQTMGLSRSVELRMTKINFFHIYINVLKYNTVDVIENAIFDQ